MASTYQRPLTGRWRCHSAQRPCGLRRYLIATVAELDQALQPVPATRAVRQVRERGRSLTSSQPSSGCQRRVSLPCALSFSPSAVRNSRLRVPELSPLGSGQPGVGKAVPRALSCRPLGHRYPALHPLLNVSKPGLERLEPCDLPCRSAGSRSRASAARRPAGSQRGLRSSGRGLSAWPLCREVPARELPCVLASPRDRPGPPHDDSAVSALFRSRRTRTSPASRLSFRTACGKVASSELPQVPAHRPSTSLVTLGDVQPGPHPRPCLAALRCTAPLSPVAGGSPGPRGRARAGPAITGSASSSSRA